MFQANEEADVAEPTPAETAANEAGDAMNETAEQANQAVGGVLESIGVPPSMVEYVAPSISALLILIVGYFVARTLARIFGNPVRRRVDETLGRFVSKLVFYVIMTCVLLAVLGMFGVNVTSFAAILGAAGFAVGLAFQGTLGNFAAGVLLLVFRPFKVGDVINAAGITAKVAELDLFTTVLDTPDNRRIVVPNGAIAGGTIENISYHSERRVDVPVGVDYSATVEQTRVVLTQAAESLSDKLLTGEGRGYQIVLGGLGDSSVNWTVRFWCKADSQTTPIVEETTEKERVLHGPRMSLILHDTVCR